MKKSLTGLLAILLVVVVFASCKKAKEALGLVTATWHVGGDTYTSSNVTESGTDQIMAEGDNDNAMQVFFHTIPTASGSYKIVDESKVSSSGGLAVDEIAVEFNVGASDVYLSTGAGSIYATVSVDSEGNVTVDVPSIPVDHRAGGPSLGTSTGDGHIED